MLNFLLLTKRSYSGFFRVLYYSDEMRAIEKQNYATSFLHHFAFQ